MNLMKSWKISASAIVRRAGLGLLAWVALAPLVTAAAASAQDPPAKPNIFWIFLDDQDPWWGCYGNKLAKTPNLDRFAKEGMRFEKTFVANPVCSPSHTALFTGNYATTLGCPDHRGPYLKDLPKGYFSIEELLRQAGYFTVSLVGDENAPSKLGHNQALLIEGASGKTDLNFRRDYPPSPFEHEQNFDPLDSKTVFRGKTWDKRAAGQPFFAYANVETGKAYGFKFGRRWARANGAKVDPAKVSVPPYLVDTPSQRDLIAMVHETVSHTDAVIGRLLDGLAEAGFKDNTFVFIASDHGRATLRHKQWLYDTGLHVPMILRWPGHIAPGSVCGELTSLIDVAPTTLIAAGLTPPTTMEGLDLLGNDLPARKEVFAHRDSVDGTFDMSRAIRTKRFKYIRNFYPELPYINGGYAKRQLKDKEMVQLEQEGRLTPAQAAFLKPSKPAEELYDIVADPFEVHNLADDPKFESVRVGFAEQLAARMKVTKDRDWDVRELLGVEEVKPNTSILLIVRALVDSGKVPLEQYDKESSRLIMRGANRLKKNKK